MGKEDIQNLTNTLLLNGKITDNIYESEKSCFDAINELTTGFMKVYNNEKSKLPYHINILDLIWANENAHSRIFGELLNQNTGGKFELLDSFTQYVAEINSNFNLSLATPIITTEKDRIDLLVLDRNFALIIENKIHGAVDQGSQLARYITRVKKKGYPENQIYVIYLTRDGSKQIEDQSWKFENGIDYKDSFVHRFCQVSFRENILPWLKIHVLPNCRIKDIYLKSTIEQYIDYLEGMFNSRKINKMMNTELENHIIKVLDLKSTPELNYSKLNQKINELSKVRDQLYNLKQITEQECWNKWIKDLMIDFPSLEIIDQMDDELYPKVGVIVEQNEMSFRILIESNRESIYYGIERFSEYQIPSEDFKSLIMPLIEGFEKDPKWWFGNKKTSFENGYSKLKTLIKEVIVRLNLN